METWRLIPDWDAAPGWAMSLDEALLVAGASRPTLRLYTFAPDTLSLGYFQRWVDVPETGLASAVVRRMTGGGAIHHQGELTFSITAPADHVVYAGAVRDSYVRVHAAIASCLEELGVDARLRGPREGTDAPLASDRSGSGMCFHRSTDLDLIWGNSKGVGSAQRRSAGRVLHHGSIKIQTTPLEGPIATLAAEGSPQISPQQLGEHLMAALAAHFDLRFEAAPPTPAEEEHAMERSDFFTGEEFLHKR